jgi:hypothetical protein
MTTKLVVELYKILKSSSGKWAVEFENFEKKNHGRFLVLAK